MTDPGANGAVATTYLSRNKKQAAHEPPVYFVVSDNPLTALEVAQETAPATLIEWRDVGGKEVADAAIVQRHLTDINRRIVRQRIGCHAARRLNDRLNIAVRFNANQQIGRFVSPLTDTGDKRATHLLMLAEELSQ